MEIEFHGWWGLRKSAFFPLQVLFSGIVLIYFKVVEISISTEHLLSECEAKGNYIYLFQGC